MLNDEEKIKLFDSIWELVKPELEKQVTYSLRNQIEREMTSVISATVRAKIGEILKPEVERRQAEISERVLKKFESSIENLIEQVPNSMLTYIHADLEKVLKEGLSRMSVRTWDLISRLKT